MKKLVLFLAVLSCLVFSASALANNGRDGQKVDVCHVQHGVEVSEVNLPPNQVEKFLADHPESYLGECDGRTTVVTPPVVVPSDVVVTQVSQDSAIWLCDTNNQLNDYSSGDALGLLSMGYVEAQAVDGNVAGGTNVGGFHLVCGSTLAPTGLSVGDGGEVYGVDYGPAHETTGFYALVR